MDNRLQRVLRTLPVASRLGLMVGVFVAIVGCLVLLAHIQLQVLSGVRAYIGGESQWSKAQKEAVLFLKRYADTRNPDDYQRFLAALAVPLGDRRARLELERPNPDPAVVTEGFLAGGNHADDIAAMARFYRHLNRVSYMATAVKIWSMGDRYIDRLRRLGEELHEDVSATTAPTRRMRAILAKVDALNDRMTPLEATFSRTLGEGARWIQGVLLLVTDIATAALLTIGLALSWVMFRNLKFGEEARVFAALARVGRELISSLETPVLLERLCQLTTKVLACDASETLLWNARDKVFAPAAASGLVAPGGRTMSLEMASSLFSRDAQREVAEVHLADTTGQEPQVQLAMALRNGGEIVGIQLASRRRRARFTQGEHRIAEGIAYVASMALANARLVSEIARVSRLKSEFVSTISHELRTPLHLILGYAEILRDAAVVGRERDDALDRIEGAGRDLLALIDNTLEIGRIDTGQDDELQYETIEVAALWERLGETCSLLPRQAAVELQWINGLPKEPFLTDVRRLTVVVRNLVGNALKFTERGWVRVEAQSEGGAFVLRVADTGIGIRREDQETIFEMFRQADGSDTRRFGGTGLGLYIVRRFTEQLGGNVTLESIPEQGSTFTVVLPNRRVEPDSARAA